jgi:Na+/melibiose symporter-like transporter
MSQHATSPAAPPPSARLSAAGQLWLSLYWLAYNLQWAALLAIVLPSQVAAIVGEPRKELATGLVLGGGAFLSLVLTPLAGAWSDRSRSRFGRRHPFLVLGTLLNVLFLLAMGPMAAGTPLAWFMLAYLGVQFGSNLAGGPYAALIPDLVPESQRGAASGWMALMSTLGMLAGVVLAGQLAGPGRYVAIDGLLSAALVLAMLATVLGVRERRPVPGSGRDSMAPARRGFFPDPREHRDFYWVLGTRTLVGMGIYTVFSFFQFFLADVLRVARPEQQTSYLIGAIVAAGIPTSLVGGARSDRVGRKPIIYLSGGVMAAASVLFVAAGALQSLPAIFAVGALFGLGYGAYQAVDWALAVDVLPGGGEAARDMGIWHVALVLPQVLAPALSGVLLSALKPLSPMTGYVVVFAVTAAWFVAGTLLVSRVRGAR